jgi:hypothetical protein
MPLNVPWAIDEVGAFITACETHKRTYDGGGDSAYRNPSIQAMHDDVIGRMPVIEQIADHAWPDWRNHLPKRMSMSWEYTPILQVAKQLLVLLKRKEELEKNLGEIGPTLSVATMHPDVWDAAKSLRGSKHFGDAVDAAARSVNATLQTKVARRDLSDVKLVSECFSLDAPKSGCPRLRLMAQCHSA